MESVLYCWYKEEVIDLQDQIALYQRGLSELSDKDVGARQVLIETLNKCQERLKVVKELLRKQSHVGLGDTLPMICENCEKELDECNCVECGNCLSIEAHDNLDRNGHCLECQGWECPECGLDLEGCDCDQ